MMYVGIMVVAFIGMVIGLRKEKGGAAWGRPVAILCIIVALLAAGMKMKTMFGGGNTEAANINTRYLGIKGEVLGGYLNQKFAGKKALVLLPPEMPAMGEQTGEPSYKAVLNGIKKAMPGVTIVAEVEPKMPESVKAALAKASGGANGPEDMVMMPEGQMWFDVSILNKELEAYKGKFDLLICLVNLPGVEPMSMGMPGARMEPYTKLGVWADKNIKIALSEGGIGRLGRSILDGKICAAVVCQQKISDDAWDKQPPSDLQAAFDMRFVLITPENVKQNMSYFSK